MNNLIFCAEHLILYNIIKKKHIMFLIPKVKFSMAESLKELKTKQFYSICKKRSNEKFYYKKTLPIM